MVPGPLGGGEHGSPAGTAGVPKPPASVLQPLHQGPSGLSCCPLPSVAGGPQLPRTPPHHHTRTHTGWEAVSRNPFRLPPHLRERGVHTTPQPISTARKTCGAAPAPQSIKFSQKRLSGRSNRELPASEREPLTFPEPEWEPAPQPLMPRLPLTLLGHANDSLGGGVV